MTTPDEIASQIIRAAQGGDGIINVQQYAELLIRRRDEEVRQDEISRCAKMWAAPAKQDFIEPKLNIAGYAKMWRRE